MSDAESLKLYVNDQHEHHFPRNTTIKEIIFVVLQEEVGYLYIDGAEEPISLELTIGEVILEKHGHVHISTCKRVDVTVEYAGQSKQNDFPSNAKVKTVLEWAVGATWSPGTIVLTERPKFALYLPGIEKALAENNRVGTYIVAGSCKITFELALRERQQG
jgi:hypothetical protein